MKSIATTLLTGCVALLLFSTSALGQLQLNGACVDTRFGGEANCTANDSSDEAFTATLGTVWEGCDEGTLGYAEVNIDVVFSQQNAATRYDVGAIVNTERGDAKTDTGNNCAARHLLEGNPNAFNVDGDVCADRQQAGNIEFTMENVVIKCGPLGEIEISMCRVWDNNANTECTGPEDLKPGTASKCSCGEFDLGTVLPVELTAFTGEVDRGAVTLRWRTASEKNNAGFAVEHAYRGAFREVGFVTGRGTTLEESRYSYALDGLNPGKHRFRLKQVDYDGAHRYSSELELTVGVPGKFLLESAYPNPFNPSTTINFLVPERQQVTMELYSVLGMYIRTLFSGEVEANDTETVRVDASGLPSGVYIVRLNGRNFTASQQITLTK